ncbi:MAG: glycosyltransferase family 1 protein [Chthoniobacteraceae bacterium]
MQFPSINPPQADVARVFEAPPTDLKLQVLLVGNYPRDGQESMLRFATAMLDGLRKAGVSVELILPPVCLGGAVASSSGGLGKWLAYLDKYVLFPIFLRRRLRKLQARNDGKRVVVHICDHSNAVYTGAVSRAAILITCHDLLAVRGALGEETDCPASATGKWLQRWIRNGLSRANIIACDSSATKEDADRLVDLDRHGARTCYIPIGLNHPYRPLSPGETATRLAQIPALQAPFVLHVGSNLRRKNREGVMRIFAKTAARWNGRLVFAGEPISAELHALADSLQITDRITEVRKPGNDLLEALYNRATCLLFPSRFEGFGWPIIEAQACGCPVVCSASGPLPEVAGEGGLIRDVEDEAGLAEDVLRLTDPAERAIWQAKALANLERFTTERMVHEYLRLYGEALSPQ